MYVTHMYYILNIHTLYDTFVRRYVCMYVCTTKQMNEAHTSTNVQCRLEAYTIIYVKNNVTLFKIDCATF